MPKRIYTFRFDVEDVNTWRRYATGEGKTLSDWIREKLNDVSNITDAEDKPERTYGDLD